MNSKVRSGSWSYPGAGWWQREHMAFERLRGRTAISMLSESLKGVISQVLCKKIGGGRVAAREIMLSTPSISNLIREGKTFQLPSVLQTSRRLGMVTMNDALIELVEGGLVEPQEAYLKATDKVGILNMLKQRGKDISFADPDDAGSGVTIRRFLRI